MHLSRFCVSWRRLCLVEYKKKQLYCACVKLVHPHSSPVEYTFLKLCGHDSENEVQYTQVLTKNFAVSISGP